jgi:hypothetical protein
MDSGIFYCLPGTAGRSPVRTREFTPRDPGKARIKFEVHEFVLHDLGSNEAMTFQAALSNREPPGEIRAMAGWVR